MIQANVVRGLTESILNRMLQFYACYCMSSKVFSLTRISVAQAPPHSSGIQAMQRHYNFPQKYLISEIYLICIVDDLMNL